MFYSDQTVKAAVITAILLGGLLLYRTTHPATVFAADGSDPAWDAAARRCLARGRPTVLLFTADWCPACRALHAGALARPEIMQELAAHYSFYTVDLTTPTPSTQAHARQFRANYIPLLIRFDKDGNETARDNIQDPATLMTWLKSGE